MTKPVLLTVDDDLDVLAAIARDLRKQYGRHYRILRADSGGEALELLGELKERGEPVALLLSDQRMPRMDGVEFLTRAKKLHPRSRRALLTAYADTEAAISAINKSQVDYYLLKPWDPPQEKLFPVLDDLLDGWRAEYRPGYGGIRVVGHRWSAASHKVRDFLARNQVPYQFFDVDASPEAKSLVPADRENGLRMPLVILPDGKRLEAPEPLEIAAHIGLKTEASEIFYDLAIVGAGPAGLASAVYGGSEGLCTVLIEREAAGGQAGTSSRIENYLGFPAGISGGELARRAADQAKKFGVEILMPQEAVGLRVEGAYKHVELSGGSEIVCHALMLATGVSWNLLPAKGADKFTGLGVFYGSAMTEAPHIKGRTVCVVGGGNSAGQAAMYFKEYADDVVMILRGDSLSAKMSYYLVERIRAAQNIGVRLNTEVRACRGTGRLEELELFDKATGDVEKFKTNFLFAFLGATPHTGWLGNAVACDERGFILTGPDLDPAKHLRDWPLDRAPFLLETNVPGLFASGDARHASIKRVASAVGEGSVAVHFIHQFFSNR